MAGGTEFEKMNEGNAKDQGQGNPFGGGSGAGISLRPVAFLVVGSNQVRMLPVDGGAIFDRLLDYVPQTLDWLSGLMPKPDRIHFSTPATQMRNKERDRTDMEMGTPLGSIGPYA